jgi:Uma2 family endonuclease
MADTAIDNTTREARYYGLRMTAEEYFDLEDDGFLYELVDGVVCMSPSPTPSHQALILEITTQLGLFLRSSPVGHAFPEVDVHLGQTSSGTDLVYRPDIVFIRNERLREIGDRISLVPDMVAEIISSSSRRYDSETKKNDYERCGVREYWLIDPERETMTFYRLQDGRFAEVPTSDDGFTSEAVPGFALDLPRVREAFKPW